MKKSRRIYYSDEISGKETMDYIEEFSTHRLSFTRFEENSDKIFDADEEKVFPENVMSL